MQEECMHQFDSFDSREGRDECFKHLKQERGGEHREAIQSELTPRGDDVRRLAMEDEDFCRNMSSSSIVAINIIHGIIASPPRTTIRYFPRYGCQWCVTALPIQLIEYGSKW